MARKSTGGTRKNGPAKKAQPQPTSVVTPIDQSSNKERQHANLPAVDTVIYEEIRLRAYQLFEERGRGEGLDQDDWARAEAEILAKYQREKTA